MTNSYERVAIRQIEKIKEILDRVSPSEDTLKAAVQYYEEGKPCPYCGCSYKVEAEMFSQDRLFNGHSCRGGI